MTLHEKKIRELFSARFDRQLDGTAARDVEDALAQDTALAHEYQAFAEVIDLLQHLPRPEPDPDFALKVHRRIQRRQRWRRRGRARHDPSPNMGVISTLVALIVVAALGIFLQPMDAVVSAIAPAPTTATGPVTQLLVSLQPTATPVAHLVGQAVEDDLVRAVARDPERGVLVIDVSHDKLAALLDFLSTRATLRIGAASCQGEACQVVELQLR